jgi:hypothetical protein
MEEQKLEVTIKWENDNFFEITAKKNGGEKFIIIRDDENAHLLSMWSGIQKAALLYFKSVLEGIKSDMSV